MLRGALALALVSLMACSTSHPGNGYDQDFHDDSEFDCRRCSGIYRCSTSLLSDDGEDDVADVASPITCWIGGAHHRYLLFCPPPDGAIVDSDGGKPRANGSWKADRGILAISKNGGETITCIPEGDAGTLSF